MATSLAALWLLAPLGVSAQTTPTKPKVQELNWSAGPTSRSALPPAPIVPPLPPLPGSDESPVKTVTFTRPPAPTAKNAAEAMLMQQLYGGRPKPPAEGDTDFPISTEQPGPDRYFRRDSESQVFDRYRAEAQVRPSATRVVFPERVPVSREPYVARSFPQSVAEVEPGFVMHRRLLFEQPNFDRHGWELGGLQPGVSVGLFFWDVATLPYHKWSRPLQHWDSSAGKLLPGDVVPLLWYHEPISATGLAAQGMAVAGGLVLFP